MIRSIGILSFMMVGAPLIILLMIHSSIIHIGESDLAEDFTMDTDGIIPDLINPEPGMALH